MRKLKVVLIDDEYITLNAMKEIYDWEKSLEFELSGTATNGQDGLALCLQVKPDIAFIDIQMPIMNGLKLVEKLKEYDLKTTIIFLTAHQDFEYTHTAIQLGVYDYMLKYKITPELFASTLQKIKSNILAKDNDDVPFQHLCYSVLYNNLDHFQDAIQRYSKKNYILLISSSQNPIYLNFKQRSAKEKPATPHILLHNHSESRLLSFTSLIYYDISVYLFECTTPSQRSNLYSIQTIINDITLSRYGSEQGQLFFAASLTPVKLKDLKSAADYLRRQLSILSIRSKKQLHIVTLDHQDQAPDFNPLPDSEKLFRAISRGKEDEADAQLEILRQEILKSELTKEEFERFAERLMIDFDRLKYENPFCLPYPDNYTENEFHSIDDVFDFFHSLLEQHWNTMKLYPNGISEKLKTAVIYIREHYSENITQADVAEAVGYSVIHLSVLFKKELNMTFLKFLTNYRINIAKYYLCHTNYMVADISQMVGYSSTQYFGEIFKQITGMTAGKYRKQFSSLKDKERSGRK